MAAFFGSNGSNSIFGANVVNKSGLQKIEPGIHKAQKTPKLKNPKTQKLKKLKSKNKEKCRCQVRVILATRVMQVSLCRSPRDPRELSEQTGERPGRPARPVTRATPHARASRRRRSRRTRARSQTTTACPSHGDQGSRGASSVPARIPSSTHWARSPLSPIMSIV